MLKAKSKDSRFTKEHWIEKALEVLSQTGGAKIHIEKLAAKLGVTKGSFYWHFESRNDFVEQVLDYWEEKCTRKIINFLEEQSSVSPNELLTTLTELIFENDLIAYEMPVRSWAVQEARVLKRVEAIDTRRYTFTVNTLIDCGVDEHTANMFTYQYNCLCHSSGFLLPPLSPEKQKEQVLWLVNNTLK